MNGKALAVYDICDKARARANALGRENVKFRTLLQRVLDGNHIYMKHAPAVALHADIMAALNPIQKDDDSVASRGKL